MGIDPSIRKTGIALLTYHPDGQITRHTKLIKTATDWHEVERLRELRRGALAFTKRAHPIAGGAIEAASLYSVNQADKLGGVRGVLAVFLADIAESLPYVIPPSSLKKFATGNGNASKEKMILAARRQWGIVSEDEADAAWLAEFAAALHNETHSLTRKQLEAINGIREMSHPKPKPPSGGRELNI